MGPGCGHSPKRLLAPLGDGFDMARTDIAAGINDAGNQRDRGSCLFVNFGGEEDMGAVPGERRGCAMSCRSARRRIRKL